MGSRRGVHPRHSHGASPQVTSREPLCLLNTSSQEALVQIRIYFADREPVGPCRVTVPARRTKHLCFNDRTDPAPLPVDTDYASLIESNVPIVVQHTRQAENAIFSTMAFPLP